MEALDDVPALSTDGPEGVAPPTVLGTAALFPSEDNL